MQKKVLLNIPLVLLCSVDPGAARAQRGRPVPHKVGEAERRDTVVVAPHSPAPHPRGCRPGRAAFSTRGRTAPGPEGAAHGRRDGADPLPGAGEPPRPQPSLPEHHTAPK